LFALAAIAFVAGWPQAPASAQSSSDPRARLVEGNVTACAGVGFPSDVQTGSSSDGNASDALIAGTVTTNTGSAHAGQGQELDVAITGTGFVIDAIVVKGGPAYNLYTDASVLPPMLQPEQHYIPPFNRGGNVPTISHWFVCYRKTPAPTTTATTTTTEKPTTTTSSSPPMTRGAARTTIPSTSTTTTSTTTPVVTRHVSVIRRIPKASTTTQPVTSTTRPTPQTIAEAITASRTPPESGADTASFLVGCATAVLALMALAIRPR
jgi:hypothetical protein